MLDTPQRVQQPIPALRVLSGEQPCCYLPGRAARHEYLFAPQVAPADYHRLMNLNYRRGGLTIYRPVCGGCAECRQLRIRADAFRPNRAQRRVMRANADVQVRIAPPRLDRQRWELYSRYQHQRHGERGQDDSLEALDSFLYQTCVNTVEWSYYLGRRLVMAAICDLCPESLSAVYCFYEPELAHRGLGTFNVLSHLGFARSEGIPFVYLGFYVRQCAKMSYKARFRPHEILHAPDAWQPGGGETPA